MLPKFSDNALINDITQPFKNDYTGKFKQIAENFTAVIEAETQHTPLSLFLTAPYGVGKSTFIDMWGQWLRNEEKLAIKFDAWKADYSTEPLIALISQLTNQLEKLGQHKDDIGQLKQAGLALCKALVPATLKFGFNSLLGIVGMDGAAKEYVEDLTQVANKTMDSIIESEIYDLQKREKSIDHFKAMLRTISKTKPLIIFLDEVDRCKPHFSISLLEIVKHLFDVENVCFIFSININPLARSVQKTYGYDDIEAKDYLERFADFPLKLTEPEAGKFIDYHLKKINFKPNSTMFMEAIKICCTTANFSLRNIEKYLREIRLFMDINNKANEDKKIPDIYLPVIAQMIAEKRVFNSTIINQLQTNLAAIPNYSEIYSFFLNSSSREKLIRSTQKLHDKIYDYLMQNRLDLNASKDLDNLKYLKNEIVEKLYGGTSPNSSNPNQFPSTITNIKKYINHYKNASYLTNFVNLMDAENKPEST